MPAYVIPTGPSPTHATIVTLTRAEAGRAWYGIYRVRLRWHRGQWSADLNAKTTQHLATVEGRPYAQPPIQMSHYAKPYATEQYPLIQE